MIEQIDTENADRDIKTAYIACLTHTPSTTEAMQCQAALFLGDGVKDLDGTGGTFKIKINIGSQESHELSFTVTAGDTRTVLWTPVFPVLANTAVVIYLLSPNAADADVDVTGYLYDCDPLAITYNADILTTLATTPRDWILQVWRRLFKKTIIDHTSLTIKTYKDDGTTPVTTQTIGEASTIETQGAAS
jgi:hypothetical protein